MEDAVPRDIRKIPMPNWEARGVTAKVSGKWSVFFSGTSDDPINVVEPCNSRIEFVTNPTTLRPASVLNKMSRHGLKRPKTRSSDTISHLDSYTLRKMAQQKEQENQSLVIEPKIVMTKTESKVPLIRDRDDKRTLFSSYERHRIVPVISSQPASISKVPCQKRVHSRCTNRVHLYMNQPFGKRVCGFDRD